MKKIFAVASLFVLGACSDSEGTYRHLDAAGFSSIETHGHGYFSCEKSEWYSTKFTAVGPTGKPVQGVVCSGILKGSTIRFD